METLLNTPKTKVPIFFSFPAAIEKALRKELALIEIQTALKVGYEF